MGEAVALGENELERGGESKRRETNEWAAMIVCDAKEILSVKGVLLRALTYSLAVNGVMRFVFVVDSNPGFVEGWVYFGCMFVLFMAPMLYVYRRISRGRVIWFLIAYPLAVVLVSLVCELVYDEYKAATGERLALFARSGTIPIFWDPVHLAGATLLATILAWMCCRWRRGRVAVQDGMMCPGCGYSLMGACRRLCPECGREFTYQELGTTEEEFNLKVATQGREARPIVPREGQQALQHGHQSVSTPGRGKAK